MNLEPIKQISIKSYLASIDCELVKDGGYYGMYLSPYREDRSPSLKVDYNKNLWKDFGAEEGGSIIDLVMIVENCTFMEAVRQLQNNKKIAKSFSFHCPVSFKQNGVKTSKVKKLENMALLQYLESRKINLEIAQRYCEEIYYQVKGKQYFGIAFENLSNGYEVRSKYFKGCVGKKDITHLKNEANELFLFEGFIDFLSYLSLKKESKMLSFDTIVLNSIANIRYAKEEFENYETVNLFLDNDESGQNLTTELLNEFPNIKDFSHYYKEYKDLNEYLIKRKLF